MLDKPHKILLHNLYKLLYIYIYIYIKFTYLVIDMMFTPTIRAVKAVQYVVYTELDLSSGLGQFGHRISYFLSEKA